MYLNMSNTEDRTAESTRSGEAPVCQGQGRLPRKLGMRDRARRGKRWKPVRKMGSAVWVMIDRSEPGRLNSGEREGVRVCMCVSVHSTQVQGEVSCRLFLRSHPPCVCLLLKKSLSLAWKSPFRIVDSYYHTQLFI